MRIASAITLCLLLAACAVPPVKRPDFLLQDELFAAPAQPINAADVFAVSEEMDRFARKEIAAQSRENGRYRALFDALYRKGQLKLDYDSAATRTAAEAFAARSGNCLSLVVMTAAFAKELGIQVQYQAAIHDAPWSRSGSLYLRNGHVNVTLGNGVRDGISSGFESPLLIDFLPPEELRGLRTRPIDEKTVVAMFMNNRATEALVSGKVDDAYWWVRAAVDSDPGFDKSYNTLGVIYHRHNDLALAESAFRYVLAREQTNTAALANLSHLLREQGRLAEADALNRKLASIERDPPFHFFDLGQQAMARGDYKTAQDLFEKEVDRDPYYHEFHFWLAVADLRLGETERARKQLELALESSTSRGDRDLYAAKLAWIRAQR
ncbi:MAG TPA: tetratricopeptide repeat protein [Burkholderiaceae bacterium]|nr:tetratricopeptide repeat protein [Burkholderiaceae bacterium]